MTCYACEKAPANPFIKFRGPPDCISCDARGLALEFGGMKRSAISAAMHLTWPETHKFTRGRSLFWYWHRAIEQAKADKEQT